LNKRRDRLNVEIKKIRDEVEAEDKKALIKLPKLRNSAHSVRSFLLKEQMDLSRFPLLAMRTAIRYGSATEVDLALDMYGSLESGALYPDALADLLKNDRENFEAYSIKFNMLLNHEYGQQSLTQLKIDMMKSNSCQPFVYWNWMPTFLKTYPMFGHDLIRPDIYDSRVLRDTIINASIILDNYDLFYTLYKIDKWFDSLDYFLQVPFGKTVRNLIKSTSARKETLISKLIEKE